MGAMKLVYMANRESILEDDPVGKCSMCGDALEQFHYEVGNDWYHPRCWWEDKGFRCVPSDEDRPYCSNADREFNYCREQSTTVCDETITWEEWVCVDPMYEDRTARNLPRRDELSADQLEQLREWAEQTETAQMRNAVGEFPAELVLLEGRSMAEVWICPDCGELVRPRGDLRAECVECGSDEWAIRGEPLDDVDSDDSLSILSGDERAVVLMRMMADSDAQVARELDIDHATVRQHLERVRRKVTCGKEAYEMLDRNNIIQDESQEA